MIARRLWLSSLLLQSISFSANAKNYEIGRHWNILTEGVYMQRYKGGERKLVKDSTRPHCDCGCPSTVVLKAKDLRNHFDFEPGVRLGVSYAPDTKSTYEARGMYIFPWQVTKNIYGDSSLSYPFHSAYFTEDYNIADRAKAYYRSEFYTADLNYWRNSARRGRDYFVISGVFGLRYFHLQEKIFLAFYNDTWAGTIKSNYNASTRNNAAGVQGGFNFQINPYPHLSLDVLGLAGLGFTKIGAKVKLRDENNTQIIRDYDKQHGQNVVFADVEGKIGYQVRPCWSVHGGYQMFFASGMGFAPSQLSTSTDPNSERFYRHDNMIIHGILLGMDFSF
jgi:hypothetical protein